MEREGIHLWIFKGLLGLLAIIAILVLVRQLGFYSVGHIHKIIFPAVAVACAIHVATLLRNRPDDLRLDPLFLLLLVLAAGGLLQGGLALALSSPHHALRQFVPHAFVGLAAPIIYLSFVNHSGDFHRFYRLSEIASPAIVATFAIALALVYAVFLPQGGFYLGFSSDALIVPLAVAIISRRYIILLLIVFIILISGKRGVLLAFPLIVALEVYFSRISRLRLMMLIAGAAAVVLLSIVAAIVAQRLGIAPAFLEKIFLATAAVTQYDDVRVLAVATSGRSLEIGSAAALLAQTGTWFTGLGYGFGFFVPNVTGDWISYQHYVHITPFNYVLQNGLILTVITYAVLCLTFFRAVRSARNSGSRAEQFLLLLTGAYLVISVTSFTSGSDAMYWVMLGLAGAIAARHSAANSIVTVDDPVKGQPFGQFEEATGPRSSSLPAQ